LEERILEHRVGIEPTNTGFAESKYPAFTVTYGNALALKSTEKYASDTTQWVENGLEIFLGKTDQYLPQNIALEQLYGRFNQPC
jgi:hypothetical protein